MAPNQEEVAMLAPWMIDDINRRNKRHDDERYIVHDSPPPPDFYDREQGENPPAREDDFVFK